MDKNMLFTNLILEVSACAWDPPAKYHCKFSLINPDSGQTGCGTQGPFKYYVIKRLGGWGKANDYD